MTRLGRKGKSQKRKNNTMNDKQEKKIRELEEKVERTNERISTVVGGVIGGGAAIMAGVAWPLFLVAVPTGAVGGLAWHHLRKWVKNRKRDDEPHRR